MVVTDTSDGTRVQRLDAITGLRWWAAMAVFGQHIINLVTIPRAVLPVLEFGHLGVNFFFVLSGFVLTWSWRRSVDRRTFYWRRFARIYPLHLMTLVLAIPVFYRLSASPDHSWIKAVDVLILVLCILLLQGWSRDPNVLFAGNPASWTLTIEAFFYAMFPFVVHAIVRLHQRWALLVASVLIAALFGIRVAMTVPATAGISSLPLPLLHLPEFFVGMALAQALRFGWRPRLHPAVPAVGILAWLAGLSAMKLNSISGAEAAEMFSGEVITALCALLIATTASHELRGQARWSRVRPLVALGEWSYAFYLVHATLIYSALEVFGRQTGSGARSLIWAGGMLAVSIVVAWILHALIERPVEKRLRDWQRSRRALRLARSDERHAEAAL